MEKKLLKNNDGLTSRQTHHPTKNLTIQIMENKERFTTQRASVPRGTRTLDPEIKSFVLYQLSYGHLKKKCVRENSLVGTQIG